MLSTLLLFPSLVLKSMSLTECEKMVLQKAFNCPLYPYSILHFIPFSPFSKPPFHPKILPLVILNLPKIPSKPYTHPLFGLKTLFPSIVTLS